MGSSSSSEEGPLNPSEHSGWSTLSGGIIEEFTGRERGVVETTIRDVASTTGIGSAINVALDIGEGYGNIRAMGYHAVKDEFIRLGASEDQARELAYDATDIY